MGVRQGIFLLLALASAARAEPQTVALEWAHDGGAAYASDRFKAYPSAPDGVTALDGEGFVYLAHELAPGRRLLLATQKGVESPSLRVDRDMDGQLDDEEPIPLRLAERELRATAVLQWRDTDESGTVAMPVEVSFVPSGKTNFLQRAFGKDDDVLLRVRVRGHRTGRVVLGARERRILVISGNPDLRMDDADDDRVYIDLDGDGRLARGARSHERVAPGSAFLAGREAYTLRIGSPTAGTVVIERAESAPALAARPWPDPITLTRGSSHTFSSSRELEELIQDFEEWRKDPQGGGWIGEHSLDSIASKGSVAAVKFVLHVVRREKDPVVNRAAAKALANRAVRPHAGLVMAALQKERDPELAVLLLRALETMDARDRVDFYLQLLEETKVDEIRAECAVLAAGQNDAWRQALQARFAEMRSPEARFHAYRAVTRCAANPPEPAFVEAAAASGEPRLRLIALRDLAWIGRRDTRDEFLALAREEAKRKRIDGEVARLVIETVTPIAGAAEIPLLFSCVEPAKPEVRNRLIDLLGAVRDEPTTAAVREELDAREDLRRLVGIRALARIPGPANDEALVKRLGRERETSVRIPLVSALGSRRAVSAAPALVKVLAGSRKDQELQESARIALARIGFEAEAVRDYFEKEAGQKAWVRRLDAVDIVARYAGPSAAPFLADRLADDEWRVRQAAAQGLGRLRSKEGIGPLIARLEHEEDRRVRRAVSDALVRTTGQHLYDFYNLWVQWWSRNHATFAVPEEVPVRPGAKQGERKTVADFYGIPVESERAVFVIDRSGSMGGGFSFGFGSTKPEQKGKTELEKAIEETIKVAGKMKDGSKINVVLFDDGTKRWAKKLVKLGKASREQLASFLERQEPGGGTNLYDALELAMRLKEADTIYLLSDGAPSAGRFVDDDDILREIGALNKMLRIQIHCISLGSGSSLLKQLAEQSGGTYAVRR